MNAVAENRRLLTAIAMVDRYCDRIKFHENTIHSQLVTLQLKSLMMRMLSEWDEIANGETLSTELPVSNVATCSYCGSNGKIETDGKTGCRSIAPFAPAASADHHRQGTDTDGRGP